MNDANTLFTQAMQLYQRGQFGAGLPILEQLAQAGHLEATKEVGYSCLLGLGCDENRVRAFEFFKQSEQHPESQYFLWHLLFFGHGTEPNKEQAYQYLKQAAAAQFPQAIEQLQLLNEVVQSDHEGDAINPANIEKAITAQAQKNQKNIRNRHGDFLIQTVDSALSAAACDHLIRTSRAFLKPSLTIHPVTKQPIKNTIRTSSSATLDWLMETPCTALIMETLARSFDQDLTHCENASILNYHPGQEYKPHHDFIGNLDNQHLVDNQRKTSLIVYLNDVPAGGATAFPLLNLTIEAQKGRALLFENIDESNQPLPNSLHAGEPVKSGEKWALVLWFRLKPTDRHAPAPANRP